MTPFALSRTKHEHCGYYCLNFLLLCCGNFPLSKLDPLWIIVEFLRFILLHSQILWHLDASVLRQCGKTLRLNPNPEFTHSRRTRIRNSYKLCRIPSQPKNSYIQLVHSCYVVNVGLGFVIQSIHTPCILFVDCLDFVRGFMCKLCVIFPVDIT